MTLFIAKPLDSDDSKQMNHRLNNAIQTLLGRDRINVTSIAMLLVMHCDATKQPRPLVAEAIAKWEILGAHRWQKQQHPQPPTMLFPPVHAVEASRKVPQLASRALCIELLIDNAAKLRALCANVAGGLDDPFVRDLREEWLMPVGTVVNGKPVGWDFKPGIAPDMKAVVAEIENWR